MMSRVMKDSGVEWIGEIPKEWNIAPISRLFFIKAGGDAKPEFYSDNSDKNHPYPVYTNTHIENKVYAYTSNPLFPEKSITVSGRGAIGKAFYRNTPFDAIIRLIVLVAKFNLDSRYFAYFISVVIPFNTGSSAIGQLSTLQIAPYKLAVPPVEEQQKIASFLDEKVAHIDNILEDTKKSIEYLKAYKKSLITETVTKGLNANVEMKDTGIEWIGQVPKHWLVNKTKNLFTIKKRIANELGHDVLSITQSGLKVKDISSNEGQLSANYSKYQIVGLGDFAMNHMDLLTGWVDLAKMEGVTSPDYRVFTKKENAEVYNLYFKYIFQMCYSNKIYYGLGQGVSKLGRWRLPTDAFLNFYLPIPSIAEQEVIASFLDEKTAHIDSLIEEKNHLLLDFESYKKSLIYEYVTGKKEVH